MNTATHKTAIESRNDSRLEHSVIHFMENGTTGLDAMQTIYECMYGILTDTVQEARKGA